MSSQGPIFDCRDFFFLLGAQKSGTTWLAELLGRHSQIHLPRAKELHYFTRNYHKGPAWYRAQFANSSRPVLCDATPNYLAANYPEYRDTPARIADAIPQARFIVVLRDPVERAISAYMHHVVRGRFSFRHSIDEHIEELVQSPLSTAGIIEFGDYFQQLQIYFRHFPRDRFLILTYENDLVSDPAGAVARILQFLNVDREPLNLQIPRRNVGIKSAASARLGALLSARLKDDDSRMGFGGYIQQFCVMVERSLRFKKLALAPAARRVLTDRYRDNTVRLAQLTGLDVSGWTAASDFADRPRWQRVSGSALPHALYSPGD